MEEELMEIAKKQKQMLNLEMEGEGFTEKKLLLARRTQEQLEEILRRKQSLSLNLKRVLPASPSGKSSSGDEIFSNCDLKSLQDACNRKLQIASALSLLPQDAPSSIETADTFHTAAADSPEPRLPFGNEDLSESLAKNGLEDAEEKETEETKKNDEELKVQQQTQFENRSKSCLVVARNYHDSLETSLEKCNNSSTNHHSTSSRSSIESIDQSDKLERLESMNPVKENDNEDNLLLEDSVELPIQQNTAMKRLNQRIARQRMTVMRCLEANTPLKEDLNRQIAILQDLQKQQIELEVSLLEDERKNNQKPPVLLEHTNDRLSSGVTMDRRTSTSPVNDSIGILTSIDTTTTTTTTMRPHFFKSNRPNTNEEEQRASELMLSGITSGRGYSTVYLTSQNRGDRLSSPYSLTITRSLPSLVANDTVDSDSVINMIVSIPSYVIRGAGTSSHYEYEVRVVAQDDSWTLLRRYRRFRELYISMRQKYGSKVAAIRFPPRQFLPRYEVVARQRRKRLEEYLRRLIQVCSELPHCEPLYKFNGNLSNIDKQSLLEFSSFFRRGTFESSKYGTS